MRKIDLTEGNIVKKILLVAIPAVLSSLVQMTYNLTDMFWISRVTNIGIDNTKALAAVGTAGYYLWLGYGFILLTQIGLDAFVPQSAGKNDDEGLNKYVVSGIVLTIVLAFFYSMFGFFFREELIGIFNVQDPLVVQYAVQYLSVVSLFVYFHFLNPTLTSVFNGLGKAVVPLIVNTIGIVTNIILDPVFILVLGKGVQGAAIATVISQALATLLFVVVFASKRRPLKLEFLKVKLSAMWKIVKVSYPMAIQSALFTLISVYIGVLVASFGPSALATQRIGTQVESLAWMVSGGFRVALAAFVGQNLGAQLYDRIEKGYFKVFGPLVIYGVLISVLMFFGADFLYSIFNPTSDVLTLGVDYLKILSLSQLFMVIEIATQGAFNGIGKNNPPSLVGIVFNILRIPGAIILSQYYGINGIWIAISISSVFKGIILTIWWIIIMKRRRYATI